MTRGRFWVFNRLSQDGHGFVIFAIARSRLSFFPVFVLVNGKGISMRNLLIALSIVFFATGAAAENATPYSGTEIIETGKPFAAFLKNLKNAIRAHKLGIVAEACATCGAKAIGVTIPGNRVVMVFAPKFAVRMLKASEAAGVEAPLRLYITEQTDGTAKLSYRLPSHVFAPYAVPDLDAMALELDQIFAKIVKQAGA